MKQERKSRLGLIATMVIFGTIGVFRKCIPLSSSFLAMTRGFVGALFLILVTLLLRKPPSKAAIRKNLLLLILSGSCIGFNWILLFEAYNYTSVATATLCYYFSPIFVILFAPLVLHDTLTRKKLLCVLLALLGMVFVSGILEVGIRGVSELRGVLLALGAALLYAADILMNKRMTGIGAYDKTTIQLFVASVVILPYTLLSGDAEGLVFTPQTVWMLGIVCILHTGIAYALYFSSIEHLPAQTVALFSYIDPVIAVILSAVVLHERMTVFTLIGAVLILGAAIWSELPEIRKKGA